MSRADSWKSSDPELETLFSVAQIRRQAERMFKDCQSGKTHFSFHESHLSDCADFVIQVTKDRYPNLKIPFHSRWPHFDFGGVPRLSSFESSIQSESQQNQARSRFDLVMLSVLVDAGAGMAWGYTDPRSQQRIGKSEGLAVASLDWVLSGRLSQRNRPEVQAQKLVELTLSDIEAAFQVSKSNPLVGLEGRLTLLQNLGRQLLENPSLFPNGRCSDLLDQLSSHAIQNQIPAEAILRLLQKHLGSIWPGRSSWKSVPLGDVWAYAPWGAGLQAFVPFHKLSQWLTLSLVDPVEQFGLRVIQTEALTPLPEYRNGGLLLDFEILKPRDSQALSSGHSVASELVVEWRALTVHVLEKVADLVRQRLGLTQEQLPTGKVLEGGTWAAGRLIAAQKRADGGSPLKFLGDGTVI